VSTNADLETHAWCTFRLAGADYGVRLDRVQEVLRPLPISRLPLAPPAIVGLIHLRGKILPVVDPRVPLGLADSTSARGAVPGGFVVVRAADGPVALLVDAIGDVRRRDAALPPPSLAPAAPAGHDDHAPLIGRTLAFPDQLLVELDLDRVLEHAFTPLTPTRSALPAPTDRTRS
jgi:purine-binding chemotaxis protein CheW